MMTTNAAPYHDGTYLQKRALAVRSSLALSPDGRWVATVVQGLSSGEARGIGQDEAEPLMALSEEVVGSEVVVVNTQSGQMQQPFSGFNSSCLPAWSPDGKWLALLTQSGERRYPRLTLWSLEEDALRVFEAAPMSPLTSFQALRWTDDSRRIVFIATVASAKEKSLVSRVATDEPDEDRSSRFYNTQALGVLDIESSQVSAIGSMTMTWAARLSPDAQHASVLRYTHLPDKPQNTQANWRQLVVTSLHSGAEHLIGEPQTDTWGCSYNWSPDGGAIAWLAAAHHSPTKLFVAELGTAELGSEPQLREIALPEDTKFGFTSVGWYPPPSPLWSHDGNTFYLPGQSKLWRFTREGDVAGVTALPEGGGFDWLNNSITALDFPRITSIDEGDEVWLWRPHEVWKVNPATGAATPIWKREPDGPLWGKGDEAPARRSYGIERAFDTAHQTLYTIHSSEEGVIKLYGTILSSGETRVVSTLFTGLGEYEQGPVRWLTWTLPDSTNIGGTDHGGINYGGTLLLPVGWREGDKPPVVMAVYGGACGKGHLSRAAVEGESMVASALLLSAHGYAVLVPDMPESEEHPVASLIAAGEAAAQALRESQLVDADRMAVMGSSYGGYTTLCLVTGTKLFKAAIAANGIYDLLRSATDGDWGWAETGQGRMRASVWENPTRYLDNSPLYALDKLEAPLLILQGGADEGTLQQGQALCAALRRLGKRGEMLTYHDAGHAPTYWSRSAQQDWHSRLLSFLSDNLNICPNVL